MKNDEPLSFEQIASFCATYEALKETRNKNNLYDRKLMSILFY